MELFYGEDNLNAEVQEADGVYTLTYQTADKRPPIGTGLTLTVKFHGDSNIGSGEAVIEGVTLAKKSVSAVVDGTVTKPRIPMCLSASRWRKTLWARTL